MDYDPIYKELRQFIGDFWAYFISRLGRLGINFEKNKDFIVDLLMVKRGANTSLFVHLSILGLALSVLVGGGIIAPTSVVSGSFPGVPANPLVAAAASNDSSGQGIITSTITPVTIISDKPRDKIVDYTVKGGDTITSVAKDFQVSPETIYWENNLNADSVLKPGDTLKILPVSGVAYKVQPGDTIYSVAKTYQANAQAIIDFPFNNVGDNFQLTTGDTLIIPDGAPPAQAKPAPTQYLASGQEDIQVQNLGSAQFIWPASGEITQYFSWYHPGIDIANLAGGPIHAADSGTIVHASWDNTGYGNMILIDHGNGFRTRYGHLSAFAVTVGQKVTKGQVIGQMGSTGRSTGTHLHFEIMKGETHLNPFSFLSH